MKKDVHNLKNDVQELKSDVHNLKNDVQELKIKVKNLETGMENLNTELQEVKRRVTKTELTIENEIRINIQRVAEGHLDLLRKLNELVKLYGEIKDKQEVHDIYINMHDNKLKALVAQ